MSIREIIDMYGKYADYYDIETGALYRITVMYYDRDRNKTIIPVVPASIGKLIIGYVEEEGDLTK